MYKIQKFSKLSNKQMRATFSFILIFAIFGFALTDKLRQKKIALFAKAIRDVYERRQRILQEAQSTDGTGNSTSPEEIDADSPNQKVAPNSLPPLPPNQIGNTNANLQIMKFHDFEAKDKKNVNFGVFFVFYKMKIVSSVTIRLRVTGSRRLRNLADEPESIKSECTISNNNKNLAGTDGGEGTKANYDCSAETVDFDATKANFALDTAVPMKLKYDNGTNVEMNFAKVNFIGNSSNHSSSLQDLKEEDGGDDKKDVDLTNVELAQQNDDSFTLKGTANPKGELNSSDIFAFFVTENGKQKLLLCYVEESNSKTGETILRCNGDDMNIQLKDLHMNSASDSEHNLYISVKNGFENTTPLKITNPKDNDNDNDNGNGNRYYRKSSSGLSGGAIAGIVIACVVVLAAASIAAIMLRKPSPPIDNTTVVGLKTADNI